MVHNKIACVGLYVFRIIGLLLASFCLVAAAYSVKLSFHSSSYSASASNIVVICAALGIACDIFIIAFLVASIIIGITKIYAWCENNC